MRDKLYINGSWVAPIQSGVLDVINPATEEIIHLAPCGTAEDVELAVRAARTAFDTGLWPKMRGTERAVYLRAIAEGIRSKQDHLARLEVLDNGKPLPEANWDIADAAECFDYYAGLAEELDANPEEPITLQDDRFICKVVREPLGVAGAIIPWNYPLLMAAWKVAPALAAGCTMVLKPAEQTSLTALELGAIAHAAKLPAGVLNIVTGLGAVVGQAIADHPDIDKLAFTGSIPTGSKVMTAAAHNIKCISLELGGKSPFIVFDDSDIDKAVEWILFGIFWNQGQVCSATSRVFVQDAIYERLLERLIEETRNIKIGNGLEKDVLLGPLVSKRQYEQVLAAIAQAKANGAHIACGGQRAEGLEKGYYVEPTILTNVPLDSDAWHEEIFGPVVCIRRFTSESEAIELANNSRFGLAAAVMSADIERTERVAAALRAGIVWINCSQPTFAEAPWGGYKQSGIGRELGRWGLDNYLETKQITRLISEEPWGWYIKPES